jgi:hypothetical protein
MALAKTSRLETVSVILTKDQACRLRSLAALRSTDLRRVSISDVAREVVEQGLRVILHAPHTASSANVNAEEEAAA